MKCSYSETGGNSLESMSPPKTTSHSRRGNVLEPKVRIYSLYILNALVMFLETMNLPSILDIYAMSPVERKVSFLVSYSTPFLTKLSVTRSES